MATSDATPTAMPRVVSELRNYRLAQIAQSHFRQVADLHGFTPSLTILPSARKTMRRREFFGERAVRASRG